MRGSRGGPPERHPPPPGRPLTSLSTRFLLYSASLAASCREGDVGGGGNEWGLPPPIAPVGAGVPHSGFGEAGGGCLTRLPSVPKRLAVSV